MPNARVFWPEAEVENSSSGCACETHMRVNSAQEARRTVPRPSEARLGDALLERHRIHSGSRLGDAFGSLLFHVVLIGSVLLLPLWFTNTLDLQGYTRTLLVGPSPPPPPAAPVPTAKVAPASHRNLFSGGKLLAPIAIPKQVVILKEEPLPAGADIAGVPGGVSGGVPGGQLGGVLGGILGEFLLAPRGAPRQR